MATKKHTLHDKDIHSLFETFSSPMVNPCISEAQKEKAQGISRILWLLLVTGTDSEINVYNALKNVFPRHEDNVAFGSLYFYKMKTALTRQEQLQLSRYYHNQEHFRALKAWGSVD
jgi:hypothetical protein